MKTFNIKGLSETERRPLRNLLVRGKHYKQWIPSYTTDPKTVLDQIYRNISHLHVDIQACFTNIFHGSQSRLGLISCCSVTKDHITPTVQCELIENKETIKIIKCRELSLFSRQRFY